MIHGRFGDGSECHYVFHYLMSCSNHADNANDDDDDDEVGPLCWLQSDANFPIKGLSGPASPTFTLTPTFKTNRFLPRHSFLLKKFEF